MIATHSDPYPSWTNTDSSTDSDAGDRLDAVGFAEAVLARMDDLQRCSCGRPANAMIHDGFCRSLDAD